MRAHASTVYIPKLPEAAEANALYSQKFHVPAKAPAQTEGRRRTMVTPAGTPCDLLPLYGPRVAGGVGGPGFGGAGWT